MEHRMICLDNSEWMRNGDYSPTRMKAQRDAANILSSRSLNANPENTVGIMTLAGPRCTIHATQTGDSLRLHRVLSLDNTTIGGTCRIANGIKIARLALKNRSNQKGEARIVLFVGSPVQEDAKTLRKLGAQLKKNSCGISVVLLAGSDGEAAAEIAATETETAAAAPEAADTETETAKPTAQTNREKMEVLVEAARKEDGQSCDLIVVPPGVAPLEVVRNSPLCSSSGYSAGTGTTGGAAPAGNASAPAGGSAEDQLQEALRLSLLESQAGNSGNNVAPEAMTEEEQIQRALQLSMGVGAADSSNNNDGDSSNNNDAGEAAGDEEDEDEDEDAAIQAALAASMAGAADEEDDEDDDEDGEDDEDAAIQAALAASMADAGNEGEAPALPASSDGGADAGFSNADYVKDLLANIPGASFDDPEIQAALAEAEKIQSEKSGNKDGDKKDGDKK